MTTDDRRVAEALAEIERLKAERDHLRKVIDNGLRDYMTLEAERDALRAALYGMLDVTHAWVTDSHCEFCVRHAPKTDEGEILGPVPHGSDCEYAASRAALAREGGGRSACLDCGGSECICRAERVERELLARAERAEAERDVLRADAERAMRILMDAPGLPLEIADVDELVKWTDAIAAVLIVLSDYADAALAAKEGK